MRNNKTFWRTTAVATAIPGLCLMLSGEASAATANLFTSILDIQPQVGVGLALRCKVVNVSTAPRSGTIQTIDHNGIVLATITYTNLNPGFGIGNDVTVSIKTGAYCKITVNPVGTETAVVTAKSIRSSLVLDQNGNTVANAEAH